MAISSQGTAMNAIRIAWVCRGTAAALTLVSVCAAAQTRPQWTRALPLEQRTEESLPGRRSVALTADGGALVAGRHATGIVQLHQLQAGAAPGFTRRISPPGMPGGPPLGAQQVLVAEDSSQSGFYLAASGDGQCSLLRLDNRGQHQWAMAAPGSDAGACVDLAVRADGSLIVAREQGLARVSAAGGLLWSQAGGVAHTAFEGPSVLIDAQQQIVVSAGETLHRYDLDGTVTQTAQLYQPDECCQPTTMLGLDLLPNGDLVAVGRADLPGDAFQTGVLFVFRGTERRVLSQASSDIPYLRAVHDSAGNLYVQTGAGSVRAFDADSGALRWERPAREIAAANAGVLIVEPATAGDLQVKAYSVAGVERWTRTLPADAQDAAYGLPLATGISRIAVKSARSRPDCGNSAFIAAFDSVGEQVDNLQNCTTPQRSEFTLDATVESGSLANAAYLVSAIGNDGAPRWQHETCPACTNASATRKAVATQLLADGGAWVLEATGRPATGLELKRLSPAGTVEAGIDIAVPGGQVARLQLGLLGQSGQAEVLLGSDTTLYWLRVTTLGVQQTRTFDLSGGAAAATLPLLRRLPDGDLQLAFVRRSTGCGMLNCSPMHVTLLRLAADGSERWRVDTTTFFMPRLLGNDDGSLLLLDINAVQAISAAGIAAAPASLPFQVDAAVGPAAGRHLVQGRVGGVKRYYLMDASGNATAVDTPLAVEPLLAAGPQGFLVGASGAGTDAQLLDAALLAPLAQFDIDGQPGSDSYRWLMQADGSLYAQTASQPQPAYYAAEAVARLARFAVPGTAAADRIFISVFE
jgi:PQQ-like domain